jgi:hypothetical protein
MSGKIVKNIFWKNPYSIKYKKYKKVFLFANLFTIIISYFFTEYISDPLRLVSIIPIITWFGGMYYLKKYQAKVIKYDEENEYRKWITEEEYIHLERQNKLERILK